MKIEVKITDEAGNVQQYVVSGSLPTDNDIEKEAKSYVNAMSSMAESIWMPEGFKEGAKWMRKKLIGQ